MTGTAGPLARRRRLAVALVVTAVFLAAWPAIHPARPLPATSDTYTHLSVARHLCRGDGFVTDVAYPLSFAFPFARTLPQPLLHRQPGFACLLTMPYLAAGGDPARTVVLLRALQIVLLGGIVFVGLVAFDRRGRTDAVLPWLLLLGVNPLLAFAVDWGLVEVVCSLLLLVLWLRGRDGAHSGPGWADGLLAGLLALLRLDLVWVPVLWWVWRRGRARRSLVAMAVLILVLSPWAVRNLRLTGNPVFSVQSYAEHAKDTWAWHDYDVYRQLEPQPLLRSFAEQPEAQVRKIARGLRFYAQNAGRLLPWPFWWVSILVLATFILRHLPGCARYFARDRDGPAALLSAAAGNEALAAATLTILLLATQYAVFNHDLRHLLVLLPVLAWELAAVCGGLAGQGDQGFRGESRSSAATLLRRAVPPAVVVLALLLFPLRLPGWQATADLAVEQMQEMDARVTKAKGNTDPVLFVEWSAVSWYADRPAVWSPLNDDVARRIVEFLDGPS